MFKIIMFSLFMLSSVVEAHEMQHGFILSDNDRFFSHLVAGGHHSHQLSASGELIIPDSQEKEIYLRQKSYNIPLKKTYFLFQAQHLNLPTTKAGQVLHGHIIESDMGDYNPKNIIVQKASLKLKEIHINTPNPFFAGE